MSIVYSAANVNMPSLSNGKGGAYEGLTDREMKLMMVLDGWVIVNLLFSIYNYVLT
jgi:hypothetical protein